MKKDKGVIIFFAVMLSFISLIISFLYTIISEEESSPTPTPGPAPRSTRIPINNIGPSNGPSPSNSPITGPYTYYEEENPTELDISGGLCTGDTNAMINHCTNSTNCGAIGKQSNGCWHMFKGNSLPAVSDTTFYSTYRTVLEKKNDFKLFYGGDGALGRDGRNACTMTDEDKEAACAADTKLQLIASGDSCGHKYYGTDKGMGSKLPTAYTNNYFCGAPISTTSTTTSTTTSPSPSDVAAAQAVIDAALSVGQYRQTGSYDCTGDWNSQITKCTNESSCKAIGQHANGCWQKFEGGEWNPNIYAKYLGGDSSRMVLQKNTAFKQFYLSSGGCADEQTAKTVCTSDTACTAVGKQSNGCWHTLQNQGDNEKSLYDYDEIIMRKVM